MRNKTHFQPNLKPCNESNDMTWQPKIYHTTSQTSPSSSFCTWKAKNLKLHSRGQNYFTFTRTFRSLPLASIQAKHKGLAKKLQHARYIAFALSICSTCHGRRATARIAPTSPQATGEEYPRPALLAAALRWWLLALRFRGSTAPAPPCSGVPPLPLVCPPLWLLLYPWPWPELLTVTRSAPPAAHTRQSSPLSFRLSAHG